MSDKRKGILSERISGNYTPEVREAYLEENLRYRDQLYYAYLVANKAHLIMLSEKGIVNETRAALIASTLLEMDKKKRSELTSYTPDEPYVAIESYIIESLGEDVGGRIHTGRSRNDLLNAALRIVCRDRLLELLKELVDLRETLSQLSMKYSRVVMPGFTHLQNAQPMTFGFYLLGIEQGLKKDFRRLLGTFDRTNLNTMGAAAFAGTEFPIDRKRTTTLLGFDAVNEHAMDSVGNYDFAIEISVNVAIMMSLLSRISEDLCIWSTTRFGFVEFDDGYSTTSSIMPQKKNPGVAEWLRGESAKMIGNSVSALTTVKGVPSSFLMDITRTGDYALAALKSAANWIKVFTGLISNLTVYEEKMMFSASEGFSTATDLADTLVVSYDVSFRTAHKIVARLVKRCIEKNITLADVTGTMLDEICEQVTGKRFGISGETMLRVVDPVNCVNRRNSLGGTSPAEVLRMASTEAELIKSDRKCIAEKTQSVSSSIDDLQRLTIELAEKSLRPE